MKYSILKVEMEMFQFVVGILVMTPVFGFLICAWMYFCKKKQRNEGIKKQIK